MEITYCGSSATGVDVFIDGRSLAVEQGGKIDLPDEQALELIASGEYRATAKQLTDNASKDDLFEKAVALGHQPGKNASKDELAKLIQSGPVVGAGSTDEAAGGGEKE